MKTALSTMLIAIIAAFIGCSSDPPTDSALHKSFNENQAAFEQLHEMIQTDRTVRRIGDDVVGDIWFDTNESTLADALSAAGLKRARYDDYMNLLREIDAYRVSVGLYDESRSEIGMYRAGNVAESHSVDIVFLTKQPDTIVDDTVTATIADNTSAYLKLDESWYIYREHD